MIEENRQTFSKCSSEKVVTITGLELCAEVEYPNASLKADAPYFPLTGPVSAGVYLYNRDTHVKYILEAKSIHVCNIRMRIYVFNNIFVKCRTFYYINVEFFWNSSAGAKGHGR